MENIQSLIADLQAEDGESYLVVTEACDGLWRARMAADAAPGDPLFDRRGDRVLCSAWCDTLPAALAELDGLCG